ncbi:MULTISPECIES: hypothetical protein [Haloferax]|nr:hypothetical protein [Haloferax mediterranei]MDX5988679.1 hypothetical protein [Haloferax mediterranei ATCC 33500]
MSVVLDIESGDKATYDQQFDDNHTVNDQRVSTCTYGGGMEKKACHTCDF